jgi:hypothetical protein
LFLGRFDCISASWPATPAKMGFVSWSPHPAYDLQTLVAGAKSVSLGFASVRRCAAFGSSVSGVSRYKDHGALRPLRLCNGLHSDFGRGAMRRASLLLLRQRIQHGAHGSSGRTRLICTNGDLVYPLPITQAGQRKWPFLRSGTMI